jgi:tripeptide aminopeptidase
VGQTLQAARQRYPDAVIEEKYELEFETYTLRPDDPIVARVKEALLSLGMAPTMAPSGGGTDGNVFGAHGIRAVVIGMGDRAAHTTREEVEIPLLLDAARFCQALLTLGR